MTQTKIHFFDDPSYISQLRIDKKWVDLGKPGKNFDTQMKKIHAYWKMAETVHCTTRVETRILAMGVVSTYSSSFSVKKDRHPWERH